MVPDLSSVLTRIGPLARAVEALVDGEDVDVPPLLSVFREAHLAIAPGAHRDVVDTPTLVGALRRRPDLVLGPTLEDVPTTTTTSAALPPLPAWWPTSAKVENGLDANDDDDDGADEPRGAPRRHRCARFLIDALIVGLEGEKLRHGFRPDRRDLPRFFANPDDALHCLKAVAARPVPARVVASSAGGKDGGADGGAGGVADVLRDVLALRGTQPGSASPLHVLVGPSARAVLDLLTPSLRRLRVELALLGRGGASTTTNSIADDDDLYRGLRRLNHAAPHTVAERRQRDRDEGVREEDGLFVVDTARLVDELVDRRARGLLAPLRKQRARILGIIDDDSVDACLAHIPDVASLQVMVRANQSHDDELPTLVQAATNTILPGAADLVSLSLPWWGLRPDFRFDDDDGGNAGDADETLHYDDGGWALWQSVNLARLEAQREKRVIARPLFRRIERTDDVDVALRALAWMSRLPDRRGG